MPITDEEIKLLAKERANEQATEGDKPSKDELTKLALEVLENDNKNAELYVKYYEVFFRKAQEVLIKNASEAGKKGARAEVSHGYLYEEKDIKEKIERKFGFYAKYYLDAHHEVCRQLSKDLTVQELIRRRGYYNGYSTAVKQHSFDEEKLKQKAKNEYAEDADTYIRAYFDGFNAKREQLEEKAPNDADLVSEQEKHVSKPKVKSKKILRINEIKAAGKKYAKAKATVGALTLDDITSKAKSEYSDETEINCFIKAAQEESQRNSPERKVIERAEAAARGAAARSKEINEAQLACAAKKYGALSDTYLVAYRNKFKEKRDAIELKYAGEENGAKVVSDFGLREAAYRKAHEHFIRTTPLDTDAFTESVKKDYGAKAVPFMKMYEQKLQELKAQSPEVSVIALAIIHGRKAALKGLILEKIDLNKKATKHGKLFIDLYIANFTSAYEAKREELISEIKSQPENASLNDELVKIKQLAKCRAKHRASFKRPLVDESLIKEAQVFDEHEDFYISEYKSYFTEYFKELTPVEEVKRKAVHDGWMAADRNDPLDMQALKEKAKAQAHPETYIAGFQEAHQRRIAVLEQQGIDTKKALDPKTSMLYPSESMTVKIAKDRGAKYAQLAYGIHLESIRENAKKEFGPNVECFMKAYEDAYTAHVTSGADNLKNNAFLAGEKAAQKQHSVDMEAVNKAAAQHLSLAPMYAEHFKRGFDSVKLKKITPQKVAKEKDKTKDKSKTKKAPAPIKETVTTESSCAANDALSVGQPILIFRDRQPVIKPRSAIEEQVFSAIHFRKKS